MKAVSVNYQSYQDYIVDSDAYHRFIYKKLIILHAFQRLKRGQTEEQTRKSLSNINRKEIKKLLKKLLKKNEKVI